MSFNDTRPAVGEPVRITALVTNEGNASGTFVASLSVDGERVATKRVRLDPDESARVEFTRTFQTAGSHGLAIGPVRAGEIVVQEPGQTTRTPTPSRLETTATARTEGGGQLNVVNASLAWSWVDAGYNASVTVVVANPGAQLVTGRLDVTVDGTRVAVRNVSVPPGERKRVAIEFPAREGTVAVEQVEAGDLRVGEGQVETGGGAINPATAAGSGPGFGTGTIVVVLVGLVLLFVARQPDRPGH